MTSHVRPPDEFVPHWRIRLLPEQVLRVRLTGQHELNRARLGFVRIAASRFGIVQ